jgi:hypothetical protein
VLIHPIDGKARGSHRCYRFNRFSEYERLSALRRAGVYPPAFVQKLGIGRRIGEAVVVRIIEVISVVR